MALNDDLHRQPIPPPIYSVLFGPRVVTLPLGEELFHLGGSFWTGGLAFRNIKAIGDLQERLRSATVLLRRDLSAEHFEGQKRVQIEAVVVDEITAYAGRVPGLAGDVFYIPGVGDGERGAALGLRAIRVVRRVVIR